MGPYDSTDTLIIMMISHWAPANTLWVWYGEIAVPSRPGYGTDQDWALFKFTSELKKNKNRPVNVQKRSASESAADCRLHGLLADPNLLQAHLSTLVMVGFNKKAFKLQLDAIKDKYYEMFRNKSGKETRV